MAPPIQTAWQCTIWKALQFKHIRLASNACSKQLGGNRQPWTVCVTESTASKYMVRTDGKSKPSRNSCRSLQFACSSLAPPGTIGRAVEICQNTFAAHLPPAVISKQSAQIHTLHFSIQCATQGAAQCDIFNSDRNPAISQQYNMYQSEQWRSITADWCSHSGYIQRMSKVGQSKQLFSPLAQSPGPRCCSDQHTVIECQLHMVFVAKLAAGRS